MRKYANSKLRICHFYSTLITASHEDNSNITLFHFLMGFYFPSSFLISLLSIHPTFYPPSLPPSLPCLISFFLPFSLPFFLLFFIPFFLSFLSITPYRTVCASQICRKASAVLFHVALVPSFSSPSTVITATRNLAEIAVCCHDY